MKLQTTVLERINNPKIRIELAKQLGVTEQTIIRYIKVNHSNLTKAVALSVIANETEFDYQQLLTNDLYEHQTAE